MNISKFHSDEVIEIMIDTVCEQSGLVNYRVNFRQALQGLVRLACAEQLLEMQLDFNKLTVFDAVRSKNC